MTDPRTRVGLVGVGTMGSRISDAVRRAGFQLTVCDIAPEVQERERAHGSAIAATPRGVAQQSDVVLLSLPLPEDVRRVVEGPEGLLSDKAFAGYIVDMSTVDPFTTRDLAALAMAQGARYVDAPVLGRPERCGHWTLPMGGDEADISALAHVLKSVAASIRHVGPVGSGQVLKLLNNVMFGAINAITVECMAAAPRLGLDPEVFYDVVVDSGAASVSNLFREIGPKIVHQDWAPTFSLSLLEKDNRLAVEMAESAGATLPIASAVASMNKRGVDHGLGALDTSALIRIVGNHDGAKADA
jgi:3-hydroxyisobutyrate dehydrogenase-like beta-hydroxyacid dehydrogenase